MKKKYWIAGVGILLIVCAVTALILCKKKPRPVIEITEENLEVKGLTKEYRFFFTADSHISLADERDTEEVKEKAVARHEAFTYNGFASEVYFDALMKEAGKRDEDMVILGGDIVDSAMFASLDRAKKAIDGQGHPYLYYSGNHDFEYGSRNQFR